MSSAEIIKAEPVKIDRSRAFRLWTGILLPPIAWATQLQVVWLTTEYGCKSSDFTWNHVASAVALLFALVGLAVALLEWRATGSGTDDDATPSSRRRFMALIGIMTGVLFSVIIFAQWLPTLTGVPCGK